jgi:UDP-2,3-diacylglucosamine pyrophosphatase LpxH
MKNLWLSDLHLGNPHNDLTKLFDVLDKHQWDTIYLLGDIVDFDALNALGKVKKDDRKFVSWIMSYALNGGKVYYVPGNHDRLMKLLIGKTFRGICVIDEVNERHTLGVHGDKNDLVLKWFEWLTSWGGGSIGKDTWHKIYIWIGGWRKKIIKEAQKRNFKRVITGHIHLVERKTINGIDYINLGDWVGNSSWGEEINNDFFLYSWKEKVKIHV